MLIKRTFKAYDMRGRLVLSTWTKTPSTFVIERVAFQARLDRCELSRVDVFSSDPCEPNQTMRPRSAPKLTVHTRGEAR
jgi:hypothetical protein